MDEKQVVRPTRGTSVELIVALTWNDGRYSARCLGIPDISCEGATMVEAVVDLSARLERHIAAGGGPVGHPDKSQLWQPLPIEMLAPLDVVLI
jgi:hypothetical protein